MIHIINILIHTGIAAVCLVLNCFMSLVLIVLDLISVRDGDFYLHDFDDVWCDLLFVICSFL